MFAEDFVTLKEAVVKISQVLGDASAEDLISFTRVLRAEPRTIVDTRLFGGEAISPVLQSATTLFTGYYLQAFQLMQLRVTHAEVAGMLNQINPNRDSRTDARILGDALASSIQSENMDVKVNLAVEGLGTLATYSSLTEASMQAIDLREAARTAAGINGATTPDGMVNSTDMSRMMREAVDLSVGKVFTVTVTKDRNRAEITLTVRLKVVPVASNTITHILTSGVNGAPSLKERWAQVTNDEIRFFQDFMFNIDLMEEHKKAIIADKTGLYSEILDNRRKSKLWGYLTLRPSVAVASNIWIIDSVTQKEVERGLHGSLSDNYRLRQKLFAGSYMLLLIVIDSRWDVVTFYHRGIEDPTVYKIGDLKAANRAGATDVTEILKAYQAGSAPYMK